jgi:transcriptional regulator of acetoin/glycerol metabolism
MTLFMRYPWPGNIRELEHVIEHACIICHGDVITVADLPREILAEQNSFPVESTPSSLSLPQKLTLEEALALSNGNKSRAARLLGISRRTVYRHLGE